VVEFGELICLFPPNACRGERCGVLGAPSLQSNVNWVFFLLERFLFIFRGEFSSGNLLSASAPTKDRRLHHDLFGSGRGTSTLNLQIEF
jgi:hypothetical protein